MSKEFAEKGTLLRPFESSLLIQVFFFCFALLHMVHMVGFFFVCARVGVYNLFALEALLHNTTESGLNYISLSFRLHFYKIWWNPLLENMQD